MSHQPLGTPVVFQVGFAQGRITPPIGTSLAGFFHDRVSKRVRDELHAKAMVIGLDGYRVALVGLDLICVDTDFVDKAKALIEKDTGIPPQQVMISASHTHTGPEVRLVGNKVPRNEEWLKQLPQRITEAVKQAAANLEPCTLRARLVNVEGYVFNRLYRRRDGLEQMGRGDQTGDILGPAGPVDPALQTLSAIGADGKLRGMVVNLGMHPVTVAGGNADFFSAEWPGEVGRNIAAVYGPQVVTLFLQGSCGDTNHVPYGPTHLPVHGPAKTEQLGRGLAGAAMYAAERAEPMCVRRLATKVEHIRIPYYTRTPEIMAEVAALKKQEKLDAAQAYFVYAVETWPFDHQEALVPLQVLGIGDLAIAAVPAQIFTRIGLDIKQWSPAPRTVVVELANARVTSYVPTADQVERGAYGSRPIVSRWLSVDAGRRMADAFLVMLQQLWRETQPDA